MITYLREIGLVRGDVSSDYIHSNRKLGLQGLTIRSNNDETVLLNWLIDAPQKIPPWAIGLRGHFHLKNKLTAFKSNLGIAANSVDNQVPINILIYLFIGKFEVYL